MDLSPGRLSPRRLPFVLDKEFCRANIAPGMRIEDTLRENSAARFLVAGELVLDREDQRAWLASSPLNIGAKALALLEELMRNAGLLVTKDRLFGVGWPDQAVSDAVLTTAIREIRRALDDPARSPVWIETHHGKGYRFLPDVEARPVHPGRQKSPTPPQVEESGRPKRNIGPRGAILVAVFALALVGLAWWQLPGSDGGTQAAQDNSTGSAERTLVAILPFEAVDVEPWVADAFVTQIDNVLSRTDGIFVTDAGRKGRFGSGPDALVQAREAGIPQVLTGTISAQEGKTVAHLRLVSTRTQKAIWEERLTGTPGRLLPMIETASIAVAQSMRPLTERDELSRMAELGTDSVLALEEFEKGSRILDEIASNPSRERLQTGYAHLEKALEYDPSFARAAYVLTSFRWDTFFTFFFDGDTDPETAFARHLELLDIAILNASSETDKTLYQARKARESLHLRENVTLLEQYLERRPNDVAAIADLASAYSRIGEWARRWTALQNWRWREA